MLVLGLSALIGAARAQSPDACRWEGAGTLVDRTHDWLSRSLCWPSRWVDGFFEDPLRENNEPAASLVRLTGERVWRDDGDGASDVDLDARVWLPSAERRFSLLFRSHDEDQDPESPVARDIPDGERDNGFRGALRWVIDRTDDMDLDLDVGRAPTSPPLPACATGACIRCSMNPPGCATPSDSTGGTRTAGAAVPCSSWTGPWRRTPPCVFPARSATPRHSTKPATGSACFRA